MKSIVLSFLGLSLVANVYLASIAAHRPDRDAPVAASAASPPAARLLPERFPVTREPEVAAGGGFQWSELATDDYATFRDRLLAIGCPPESVRDLIAGEIREAGSTNGDSPAHGRAARLEARRECDRRIRETLAALALPPAPALEAVAEAGFDVAFLNPEQRAAVARIELDYESQCKAADHAPAGPTGQAKLALLSRLEEQREAALRRVLSPAEYLDHQVRNSPLAETIRENAAGFEPSATEFRSIFAITQQAAERGDGVAAEKWRCAELERALGPQRAGEFLRSEDVAFHHAFAFAQDVCAAQGPHRVRQIAAAIYDAQRAHEQVTRAEPLEGLAEPERFSTFAANREAVESQLRQALGPAFQAYLDTAGFWLSR